MTSVPASGITTNGAIGGISMKLRLMVLLLGIVTSTMVAVQEVSAQTTDDDAATGTPSGGSSISGNVTYDDGVPASRFPVEWRPVDDPNGGSTTTTDEKGDYTIEGLKDGEYFVGFFHPDRLPAGRNPGIEDVQQSVSPELAEVGAPVGKRITVKDGMDVAGVDFVITHVENEAIDPPDSEDGETAGLPETGSSGGAERNWGPSLLLLGAGATLVLVGARSMSRRMR